MRREKGREGLKRREEKSKGCNYRSDSEERAVGRKRSGASRSGVGEVMWR